MSKKEPDFTEQEWSDIHDSIENNKQEKRRISDNFSTVFGVVWILTAVLLAATTDLGLAISGIIGIIAGYIVAKSLK